MGHDRFSTVTVTHKETDLWIGITGDISPDEIRDFVLGRIKDLRGTLEQYGGVNRSFFSALEPFLPGADCPPLIRRMAWCGEKAGVGPMASVAGVIAQEIGEELRNEYVVDECIVENGGDLYLDVAEPATVSIFAGSSPLSNRLALKVDPAHTPLGICTSSGTIGHSYSQGCADAVTVVCRDAGLADAFATAIGNEVRNKDDIGRILEAWGKAAEILGTVIIVDDRLGVTGDLALTPLPSSLYA